MINMATKSSIMRYGDYIGQIEFDEEGKIFFGKVIGTRDVITFQGKSVNELEQAFHDSIDAYRTLCKKRGKEPEKTFSGKIPFRTTPDIHQKIYKAAQIEEKSINAWMNSVLTAAAQKILTVTELEPRITAEEKLTVADRDVLLAAVRRSLVAAAEYFDSATEQLPAEEQKALALVEKNTPSEFPTQIPLTVTAIVEGMSVALPLDTLVKGIVEASPMYLQARVAVANVPPTTNVK